MTQILAVAESLRRDAWDAVFATKEYAFFKAMDDAVVAGGGKRMLDSALPSDGSISQERSTILKPWDPRSAKTLIVPSAKRVPHGDAAELALIRAEVPLSAAELMERAITEGASIGGEKPVINFTSSLSKDDRFYSLRQSGQYFWWLANVAVPPEWIARQSSGFDPLLDDLAFPPSSQKGDDHDGSATT